METRCENYFFDNVISLELIRHKSFNDLCETYNLYDNWDASAEAFKKEIENNATILQFKDARFLYLKRIYLKFIFIRDYIQGKLDVLNRIEDGKSEYVVLAGPRGLDQFKVPVRWIQEFYTYRLGSLIIPGNAIETIIAIDGYSYTELINDPREREKERCRANKNNITNQSGDGLLELSGIHVVKEQRTKIFNILKTKIHEDRHNDLESLLEGKKIKNQIYFKGTARQLADTFGKIFRANYIGANSAADIDAWLSTYFIYYNSKTKQPDDYKIGVQVKLIRGDKGAHCKNPLIRLENGKIVEMIRNN